MTTTKVAVTGANGFVASYVREELAARAFDVRGLVRSPQRSKEASTATRFIEVDYEDPESIRSGLEGVDAVVHLLGHAHQPKSAQHVYQLVNVEYTRRLLEASERAGVQRFLFLSSVKALGSGADEPYTEETPPNPTDDYGRSKLEAEHVVQALSRSANIDFVILRPPLVYGAGVKGNLRRLITAIERGRPIPLARSPNNSRSLISARNLASAIGTVVAWEGRIDCAYLVSDGIDLSTAELVDTIARVAGAKARTVPIPPALLRYLARLLLHGAEADRVLGSLQVDATLFKTRFGWSPPQTIADGMREAVGGAR